MQKFKRNNQQVRFASKPIVARFHNRYDATIVTYDSGADHRYMSESDRIGLVLPILQALKKRLVVSNGGTSRWKYVKSLPFPQLSKKAAESDTFEEFPTSLISVGKTSNDGNVSIFTKEYLKVYKEEDVLITCKGKPILVGRRDERGRYRIPLMQTRGQWQLQRPTKKSKKYI